MNTIKVFANYLLLLGINNLYLSYNFYNNKFINNNIYLSVFYLCFGLTLIQYGYILKMKINNIQ